MQKMVSNATILLIKENLPKIGIGLPLKNEEELQIVADYFEDMEVCLSNAISDGEQIDRSQLDAAARAFDELAVFEDDDTHDLVDLNRRLMYT